MQNEQSEKLKDYIKSQLQSGVPSDHIVMALNNAQWPADVVSACFQTALAELAPSVSPQPASPVVEATPGQQGEFVFQPPQPATMQPSVTSLGFIGRIKTGWLLFKQSMKVLSGNKYLLRYLLMTYVWVLLVTIVFVIFYLLNIRFFLRNSYDSHGLTNIFGYAIMFMNYVVVYFVINFYAAGLTANILDIFSGKKQSHHVYMQAARRRWVSLLALSIFSATIGVVLQFIIEKLGWVGRIISYLIGTAWSLAIMFSIPLIVAENLSAPMAVKGSAKLLKKTWGESLTAKVSVNAPLFLVNVIIVLVASAIFVPILGSGSYIAVIAFLICYGLLLLTVAIIGSCANTLVNTAVFYYAEYHQVPAAFDENLLNQIFVARKRRFFKKKTAPSLQ